MIEMDTVVECGGVEVRAGDVVFADIDGVVVIPQDHASAVIERAIDKAKSENHTREELAQGRLLREVYDKYGVL